MSQLFICDKRHYGSIPTMPIKVGSKVFIVFKTVGLIREGMQYLKRVGEVTHLFYPDSSEHRWWSLCHTTDYVVPKPTDILVKIAFGHGESEIFLPKDVVHVVWLPVDRLPTMEESLDFDMHLPPSSYI